MSFVGAMLARARDDEAGSRRARIADRTQQLAVGLLLSVEPSDRALAGWNIEAAQIEGVQQLAKRPL